MKLWSKRMLALTMTASLYAAFFPDAVQIPNRKHKNSKP